MLGLASALTYCEISSLPPFLDPSTLRAIKDYKKQPFPYSTNYSTVQISSHVSERQGLGPSKDVMAHSVRSSAIPMIFSMGVLGKEYTELQPGLPFIPVGNTLDGTS